MTNAMRIECQPAAYQRREEQVLLDVLVSEFERLDKRIFDELVAGGDFLDAARSAFRAKNRIRRFLSDRPGLRVARQLAPALSRVRKNEGHHVDEFERLLSFGIPTDVDWGEVVYVDDTSDRPFRYRGNAR